MTEPGTRERIVTATAELLAAQGYEATGVKEVVARARAPFGSLYHFFPGGKEELGATAVRWSGAEYGLLLGLVLDDSPDLVSGVRAFFAGAAEHLVETGYADACPIATVALELSSRSEPVREACAEVFESWVADGVERFVAGGVPAAQARALVLEAICALEGAFVLCRATRRTEALDVAGARVADSVAAALAGGPPAPPGG